jgi:dihydroorotate dehydrogenase
MIEHSLEFHEKQQQFHMNAVGSNQMPNTHGWVTIVDRISHEEYTLFMIYINLFAPNVKKAKWLISHYYKIKEFMKAIEDEEIVTITTPH